MEKALGLASFKQALFLLFINCIFVGGAQATDLDMKLWQAVSINDFDAVVELVQKGAKADVQIYNTELERREFSAFHIAVKRAAFKNDLKIFNYLAEQIVDYNYVTSGSVFY